MHVQLELNKDGAGRLLIDGVDVSDNVSAVGVQFDGRDTQKPRLTVTLLPEKLTLRGDMSVDLRALAPDTAGHFDQVIKSQAQGLQRMHDQIVRLEAAVKRGRERRLCEDVELAVKLPEEINETKDD